LRIVASCSTVPFGTVSKKALAAQELLDRAGAASQEDGMKKQIRRASAGRRDELLQAAFAVFSEKGFSGASMLDIATRAKASKATLYGWFDSKEKLFEILLRERFASLAAGVSVEAAESDPRKFLFIAARDILALATSPQMAALARVAFAEGSLFETGRRILRDAVVAERKDFVAYLERCRARGSLSFANAEESASIFVAMAQGEWPTRLALGIAPEITDAQIDAHARLVVDMFLKAAAPSHP
jgi:TetR/AcrR family transcriptional regulator, mexJK operon transcriptional repressor